LTVFLTVYREARNEKPLNHAGFKGDFDGFTTTSQAWADYLDLLKKGADVVLLRTVV